MELFCAVDACWQHSPCCVHEVDDDKFESFEWNVDDLGSPLEEEEGSSFEWMADYRVLERAGVLSKEFLSGANFPPRRVLVPGCGRSLLGHAFRVTMCEEWGVHTQFVETDIEPDAIDFLASRCKRPSCTLCSHEFVVADITREGEKFDLVVDKGTLDALLCVGRGAEYMCKLADSLNEGGGLLLVSLHEEGFVRPLLEGSGLPLSLLSSKPRVWGSRSQDVCFIYLLRKTTATPDTPPPAADVGRVKAHFERVQDHWFQDLSPLLTPEREQQLRREFLEYGGGGGGEGKGGADGGGGAGGELVRSLAECYDILFTAVERELFSFADFTEDFDIFRKDRPEVKCDAMTVEQALEFLRKMQ